VKRIPYWLSAAGAGAVAAALLPYHERAGAGLLFGIAAAFALALAAKALAASGLQRSEDR
jgi:hypothetical protein